MAAAALRLAFARGAPHPLPPYNQLAEPQQRVVRTLAGLEPGTWRWGNFMSILGYHGQIAEIMQPRPHWTGWMRQVPWQPAAA